jgi:chaperonin GroES
VQPVIAEAFAERRGRVWTRLIRRAVRDAACLAKRESNDYVIRHRLPELARQRVAMGKSRKSVFEYVEPIGARVVVRKDEPKRETKGGIALPDAAEIPTITGRIVTISAQIENDVDVPLRQYDRILFHPKNAVPVDFEPDNQLFVVPVEDVVAVFRREPKEPKPD